MKLWVFIMYYFVMFFADYILVLYFNQEPVSVDGLLLRAFILTYCSIGYRLKT